MVISVADRLDCALPQLWRASRKPRNPRAARPRHRPGTICNTGTGSPTQGNYRVELRDAAGRTWKSGHIEEFPRKRLFAWDLFYRALEKLVGARNRSTSLLPVLRRTQ